MSWMLFWLNLLVSTLDYLVITVFFFWLNKTSYHFIKLYILFLFHIQNSIFCSNKLVWEFSSIYSFIMTNGNTTLNQFPTNLSKATTMIDGVHRWMSYSNFKMWLKSWMMPSWPWKKMWMMLKELHTSYEERRESSLPDTSVSWSKHFVEDHWRINGQRSMG